jgi:outer membrane protein OmpA-like peptidoglycan-associated protein
MPVVVAQTTKASIEAPRTASVFPAEERKVEGTIAERNGDRLTLRLAATDTDLVVKLGGFTQVQEKKSNPFRRGRKYQASQLVPGLNIIVEGRGDSDGALLAEKIRFTDDQFKSARTVDVRMAPVEENARKMSGQLSELESVSNAARGGARAAQDSADKAHDRITSLDDYEAVQSITVRFKAGSAQLSEEAKRSLDEVAQQAKTRKGYVIEVAGFASSEGKLAFNRSLSRQRAQAVSEYLAEQHDIPLRRIMIPSGYGVSHPVADNSSRAGRQENRRAEVRILVSRGIAPAAANPASPTAAERASSRPEDDR